MLAIDPVLREALVARLRFYRDIGVTDLYRRTVDPEMLALVQETSSQVCNAESLEAPGSELVQTNAIETVEENEAIPPRKTIAPPPAPTLTDIKPADKVAALRLIREDIGDCTRCGLHKGRNKLVFADGSPNARLMFVGEGPGADEDAQGLPFVGRAGQLLNNMITAMGLKREDVYIANVVKCRPPGNRDPLPEELQACNSYLERQIEAINPLVIVTLGRYSMGKFLPNVRISEVHGKPAWVNGRLIVPMFHPAAALHQPSLKISVERDFMRLPEWIQQAKQNGHTAAGHAAITRQPTVQMPVEQPPLEQATQGSLLDSAAPMQEVLEKDESEKIQKDQPTQLTLF